jgi:hypothetical protein
MSTDQDFVLTPFERTSPLWIKIELFLKQRLEKARLMNDAPLSPEQTARVRGEIAALKALVRLGREPMPPIETADEPAHRNMRAGLRGAHG